MAFDLGEVLKGVSDLDTQEQIVRLDLDLIDPDPANFYSLDGLDELAANIELVGLLDPIRVRPGENGRYTVVSGHRRRAACLLIRDGGSEQFKTGVPCIVEYGEASDAMRRLRLIYANSATRQLTSAEQSRQAEEVTRLLYELQEQGVVFPGRMRDHVAEACRLSKTKIARLHAIRQNAHEYVLDAYDKGEINESVAYEFQRLPKKAQAMYMIQRRRACMRLDVITAEDVVAWGKLYEKIRTMLCPGLNNSGWCRAAEQRQKEALRQLNGYHGPDDAGKPCGFGNCSKGRCCLKCPKLLECPDVRCKFSGAAVKRREAELAAFQESAERDRQLRQEAFDRDRERKDEECSEIWARLRTASHATGRSLERVFSNLCETSGDVKEALRFCSGEEKDKKHFAIELMDDCLLDLADGLNCSVDFLLGRAPEPRLIVGRQIPPKAETPADLEPAWQTGKPKKAGLYAVRFKVSVTAPGELHNFAVWDSFQWKAVRSGKVITDLIAVGWYPLPALEDTKEVES